MIISRRVLTIVCMSLSLLLLIAAKVELNSQAASANNQAGSLVSVATGTDKTRLSNARGSWWHSAHLQQPAQKEKTIGEVRKNIKVFNDVPESQLIPMMNLMAASLGVKCNYCHVNNAGQWDYPSDDKPEKNTAREMITMVFSVNKSTFKGNNEVSCFTCHRGRTSPVGVITLPLPEPTPMPGASGGGPGATRSPGAAGPGGQSAAPQPTVDDILNKYITAIGGQAAIDKMKTRVMKGTYAMSNGSSLALEIDQAAPDKFHVTFVSPQGAMERGFNGSAGWEKNQRGVMDLAGQQLADMKFGYTLFRDIKLKEQFTRMNARREKLDGKDVNVILAAAQNGKRERLYFDAETGLLLRRVSSMPTPIGIIPEQTDYEDYRDVDGLKVPFAIKIAGIDGFSTGTRKFTEIKVNAPLDDSTFNKPAAAPGATQVKP